MKNNEQWRIFISSTIYPYYEVLWSKSKKLIALGKVNSFYFLNGTIRIKINENSSPPSVNHVDD